MTQPTQKKLTKKERKAQRLEQLNARGITPPTNSPKMGPNAGWNEIEDIHKTLIKAIENSNGLLEYIKDPVIRTEIDVDLFMLDWKIAKHYVDTHFNPALLELHKRTQELKDRKVAIPEIMGEFTELFFDYHTLSEQLESVLAPTQYALMDNVTNAVNEINRKLKEREDAQAKSDTEAVEAE